MADPRPADLRPEALEARLGHRFHDPSRLWTALTHPSYASEIRVESNERLEFLGDAVLDLVVAELLYERQPGWREGQLTRARAALVNTRALAAQARELGLGEEARLGRTEREEDGGTRKPTILANLFEAVIGAIYIDGGYGPVRALVAERFAGRLDSTETIQARDPKTRFQEWAHAHLKETPRYRRVGDTGVEDAEDRFRVEVLVDGELWGTGEGRTKRGAERGAASAALERVATEPGHE